MSKQKFVILKEYENNLTLLMDILGSGTTDNIELNKIGKLLFGDAFVGVFSSNKMKPLNNNEMCIVNTDPDYKGGTHWCACYKYNNKTYVYDSYDRDIKSLSKYWKHKHNWVNANADRDQSYNGESNCGTRSMAWLISAQKYKPHKLINIF